jgi:transposase
MGYVLAPVLEKRLGALPVCAEFLRRLDIAGIVDRLCPVREVAHLTHGQVIEVLIANRLSAPSPLAGVQAWAREWAVGEVFGIDPGLLNDDRLGRALDAIAPELEAITGSAGAAAIAEFGVDVARLHWDMTSISLHGAYPGAEEGYPAVRYGHPKDRRPDLKQVQAGLAVAGDGGIPVFHRAYDGGAGEVSQVVGAMTALREIAGPREFLLVGDSKLISYRNAAAMCREGVRFVAPAARAQAGPGTFAALDLATAQLVGYTAGRDAGKPAAQRGSYRVLEATGPVVLTGRRKSDPPVALRQILVHSSASAAGQRAARDRKLTRAREDLERLQRGLGGPHYRDTAKVAARVAVITAKRRVNAYLRTSITTGPEGRPALDWHFDQAAIGTEAAADGWYALLTNLDPAEADAEQAFLRYKGQATAERRYSDFKGPLAVAPIFLQHNRRIAALLTVICLALLTFSLIERQARQALGPRQAMRGLYHDNRAIRPTGRLILNTLSTLRLLPATGTDPPAILINRGIQAELLELLGVDATRPRWLTTRNPMCEVRG